MGIIPAAISLAGYTAFIRDAAGISAAVLPDNSPWIDFTYRISVDTVNLQLLQASPDFYLLAVYNLGVDGLFNYAPDVTPTVPYDVPGNVAKLPFFAYYREKWKIYDFTAGVVQATSDEGTSVTLLVQKAADNFKLADLQNLKTIFGRRYLEIAQRISTLWGLT